MSGEAANLFTVYLTCDKNRINYKQGCAVEWTRASMQGDKMKQNHVFCITL